MAAITWRNIEAPDFTGASRIMGESQRMLDSGFGKFTQILEQQQKQEQVNAVAERNTNTSKYLDSVQALAQKGPGELETAIKTGAIDKLRQSFGPNIDGDKVRGAAEAMLSQRMQQAKQGVEFNNFMVDEAQKPVRDAWRVAGLKGDKETQARLEQEHPNLRNMAELYASQRNIDHENLVWDEDKKDYVRRQEKHLQDIKASNAQIGYQQGMLANAQAQTRIQGNESTERIAGLKEDRALRAEERLNKMLVDVTEKYGDTFKANPNSEKSIMAQLEIVNKLPEKARELALAAVNKARAVPGATQGSVLAVAMASTPPEYMSTDGGQVNRAVKAGEAVIKANNASGSEEANEVRQGVLGNRMKVINARLEALNPGMKKDTKPADAGNPLGDSRTPEQVKAELNAAEAKGKAALEARVNPPAAAAPAAAPSTPAKAVETPPVRQYYKFPKGVSPYDKTEQDKANLANRQYEAQYKAESDAFYKKQEATEKAEAQAKRDAALAAAQERAEKYNAKARADQDARYAKANAQRQVTKQTEAATNLSSAKGSVAMLEARVQANPTAMNKRDLDEAKAELRRLMGK